EIDRPGVRRGYGGLPLHEQLHGEAFMALFVNRFLGEGFYVLDEPEAALSPEPPTGHGRKAARAGRPRLAVRHRHAFADHHGLPEATIFLLDETACARSRTKTPSTIA